MTKTLRFGVKAQVCLKSKNRALYVSDHRSGGDR